MYEEQDNEMHGENYTDGKLNDVKEGSVIEGDVTDGEASDGDEGNWTEEEEDTDGEASDGEEEYCPEKETDTDSEESYDEEDIVMEDEGKYKKENEAVANTGKKRIRKENVKENKKNKKEGKRTKKPCPIPHCDAKVVHLPKHLRNVHKWTTESSRVALTRFKLRKKYEFVSQETASAGNRRRKKKDEQGKNPKKANRKKKLCPFSGCMVVTERLPQHLQRKHKLKRDDPRYNKILSLAKVVSNVVEDKELSNNSGSQCSFLNSHGPNLKDEEDKSSALPAEHNLTEISSLATTNASQNEDVENTGRETEILKKFCDWLVSPDGEQKDKKTANQHVSQLSRIMSVTGGGPASLVDKKKIRDVFLPQAKEKYHAATIKSYLMSLQHYCSFLLEDKPSDVGYDRDEVTDLRGKLKKWSASYKRETTRRRWERQEEDVSTLITPDKVKEFEQSQATRDAVILLGKLSGAHSMEITQAMYTLVRDYLIAQIMIDNANRAGVVAFMTVKEFQRAKMEDDCYVVEVLHHKTVDTHGPAQVILTVHLYNCLDIFLKELRAKLPCSQTDVNMPMFLSWLGKSLQSSQVTRALGSIFKKAGVEGPIHHTLYRKSAVTRCHDKHKDMSSHLADLMAHRESTAEKYYRLFDKRKSSVKASQALHGMMRETTKKEEKQESKQAVEQFPENNDSQDKCVPSARSPWKEESLKAVQALFQEEIATQDISMDCVREKIKCDPVLRHEDPKRVYDKVRAQWRYQGKTDECSNEAEAVLPEDTEDVACRVERMFSNPKEDIAERSSLSADFISVTQSTLRSKEKVFSGTQAKGLVEMFQDMVSAGKPISKPVIIERLAKNGLSGEYNVEQVVNRLKYERKQLRAKK